MLIISPVVDVLRDALLKQITEITEKESDRKRDAKLNEMLDKSFPVIKNETLQPVAMHIMKHIPEIKPKYLQIVSITYKPYSIYCFLANEFTQAYEQYIGVV